MFGVEGIFVLPGQASAGLSTVVYEEDQESLTVAMMIVPFKYEQRHSLG